jgi:IS30 family transposase
MWDSNDPGKGFLHNQQGVTPEPWSADNGREFSAHELVNEGLDCQSYFAKPYHSWERGLNENTNGLIRQYFPKVMDLLVVSREEIAFVMKRLNHRP